MLRSIGKQSGECVESVKRRQTARRAVSVETFSTAASQLAERVVQQSISLFASKYTYLNIIYVNGRSPEKTQSSTSWRPIINGTKANVVLEKHRPTIQYNIQKNMQAKRKQEAKSAKRKLKWRTAAMRDSRNNINDTDNTRSLSCVN